MVFELGGCLAYIPPECQQHILCIADHTGVDRKHGAPVGFSFVGKGGRRLTQNTLPFGNFFKCREWSPLWYLPECNSIASIVYELGSYLALLEYQQPMRCIADHTVVDCKEDAPASVGQLWDSLLLARGVEDGLETVCLLGSFPKCLEWSPPIVSTGI